MPSKQIRNACITINSTHTLPKIDTTNIHYYIFGKERAPNTGRLHLQGYVEFKTKVSFRAIKQAIGDNTIHIEQRRGTQQQAIDYCKKEDDDPFEFGEPKVNGRPKGYKTEQINDELKQVVEMINDGDSPEDILKKEHALHYRYKTFIEDMVQVNESDKQKDALQEWAESIVLNDRQRELCEAVEQQNDRGVTWIKDEVGGTGKTVWSKWMIIMKGAIRFTNAKTADLAYAYNGESVVIFDFSRTVSGRVNYGAIEDLKNGMIFSGKYKSKAKIYPQGPKVVCLANFAPDLSAMFQYRWDVRDWSPAQQ